MSAPRNRASNGENLRRGVSVALFGVTVLLAVLGGGATLISAKRGLAPAGPIIEPHTSAVIEPGIGPADPAQQGRDYYDPIKPGSTALPAPGPLPAPAPADDPAAAPDPSASYRQVDHQVQALLKRDAIWHTPNRLNQGQTGNVALTVGNAESLQTLINSTVPASQAGAPIPVTITPSVRAKLSVVGDDASISPLDAIDQSIGEHTAMFFSWVVIPHRPGQLKMQALLECTMTDGRIITQIVPLSINVEAIHTSWTSRFTDLIRNFWTQLAALGAGLLAAARFCWSWYVRRRPQPSAANPAALHNVSPQGESQPPPASQDPTPAPPPSPAAT